MSILKPESVAGNHTKPDTGRRSFIWKTGAAMSAVVASAVAGIPAHKADADAGRSGQLDRLASRIGSLEDANTIRRLHQSFESRLDQGMYEEVVGLFTDDARVIYNGGLYVGKDGIRRLYCDHFASGRTGKKVESVPGFESDPGRQLDIVEVAEDRMTATGQFPYSMQVGVPMTGHSSLVDMARLQGEGIVYGWEGGVCEVSYVKKDDAWVINKLAYLAALKADYRPGRLSARPMAVSLFAETFPQNPTGPDRLL